MNLIRYHVRELNVRDVLLFLMRWNKSIFSLMQERWQDRGCGMTNRCTQV